MPETPARGTRPRNRRAITVQVATELFYRLGYSRVSMTDIAEATNVGASALYRHFPGKADLLVAAILDGLAPFEEALAEAAPGPGPGPGLDEVLRRLAGVAIEHRRLGVLWQRDARGLPDAEQRMLRQYLVRVAGRLAARISAARPELGVEQTDTLAWFTMGALVSLGFHSLEPPRPHFDEVLTDIVTSIVASPLPAADGSPRPAAPVREPAPPGHPESRRDRLITAATALFAARGFAAAGVDEIADAAGIAGPSIYSHFESKRAVLAAAIQRASRTLHDELGAALGSGDPPRAQLAAAIDSYVRRANRDRFIIRTLISDMDQLEVPDREIARSDQRQYVDTWVDLLRSFTDLDAVSARLRVQAVLLAVNDAVETHHLRSQPGFELTIALIAKNVLGVLGETASPGDARRTRWE